MADYRAWGVVLDVDALGFWEPSLRFHPRRGAEPLQRRFGIGVSVGIPFHKSNSRAAGSIGQRTRSRCLPAHRASSRNQNFITIGAADWRRAEASASWDRKAGGTPSIACSSSFADRPPGALRVRALDRA